MVSNLLYNNISDMRSHAAIWNSIGVIGRFWPIDVNKTLENTDVVEHMS